MQPRIKHILHYEIPLPLTNEDEYKETTFHGEVAIAGSISFSSQGNDFSKVKQELQEFIDDHRSDSDQWHEVEFSEQEKSQGIRWKKIHKRNNQETATIRMVSKK